VALDYLDKVHIHRHVSWDAFLESRKGDANVGRLVLLSTKAEILYTDFSFRENDTLILGRESKGTPSIIHETADARLKVQMQSGARSLNVAIAAAMVVGEALRQTTGRHKENGR